MAWLQLKVRSSASEADSVEDILLAAGAAAVTMEDSGDQPLFEPPIGTTPLWQDTTVVGLFNADIDVTTATLHINNALQPSEPLKFEILEDKDWVRAWMDDYHPIQFGERLWICPSWCEPPQPEAVNLMLDPGLAFGTGTHPTTAMCMRWLDKQDLDGKTVWDYGCGSGILAIAALLLGAASATGNDIDPQALTASRDNAQRNGIADDRLQLLLGAPQTPQQVDVVVANILAGPLVALSEGIAALCKTGGLLALSGILDTQAKEIMTCYSQWFDLDPPTLTDEWVCISGRKR
ncbi:MAG TPA: 50S ribosomal protein L11 methyltransferase [Pseudomonadales bacterium]|nr:50S ribosomal protein L11 methyltransferase [Pseudomonadales bacterium]